MKHFLLSILFLVMANMLWAQNEPPKDWFHLDNQTDHYMGISSYKAYKELLKGKKAKTIIVAVLDSGVDDKHEDLKDIMWTNPGEIPNNGIDDDHNGYIDDIHGWNFIGGKDGKNIDKEQLEITRLYSYYTKKFKDTHPNSLSRKQKKEYQRYQLIKSDYDKQYKGVKDNFDRFAGLLDALTALQKAYGKDDFTAEDIPNIKVNTPLAGQIIQMLHKGGTAADLRKRLEGAYDYYAKNVNYYYNPDFNARKIVGDNYTNSYEKHYGNNDSKGPDSSHGTHVSGIIAAKRNNGIGIDGIADNVQIMSVRAVPDGDERDKDVANGIIYAVNNGAKIINMSFGKPYSWDKKAVDKAMRYASKHGVLLVHAAMNDSKNVDKLIVFPNDHYQKKRWFGPKYVKTWLDVGALSWKKGEDAIATFSNYGQNTVDVFAPGVAIYSTTPENTYASYNGTSMATPVTAGIAAVLMGYYPNLSAKDVKKIIMASTIPLTQKVKKTDTQELANMRELCRTGGVVNLYRALQMAAKY